MSDATRPTQNYANHVLMPVPFVAAGAVLAIDALVRVVNLFRAPGLDSAWAILPGIALVVFWSLLRRNSLRLQDRIIRLEMRLRLDRILAPDKRAAIQSLSLPQLIALRFAADTELPALVEAVLAENISKQDEIKKRIKDWQADWLRV